MDILWVQSLPPQPSLPWTLISKFLVLREPENGQMLDSQQIDLDNFILKGESPKHSDLLIPNELFSEAIDRLSS